MVSAHAAARGNCFERGRRLGAGEGRSVGGASRKRPRSGSLRAVSSMRSSSQPIIRSAGAADVASVVRRAWGRPVEEPRTRAYSRPANATLTGVVLGSGESPQRGSRKGGRSSRRPRAGSRWRALIENPIENTRLSQLFPSTSQLPWFKRRRSDAADGRAGMPNPRGEQTTMKRPRSLFIAAASLAWPLRWCQWRKPRTTTGDVWTHEGDEPSHSRAREQAAQQSRGEPSGVHVRITGREGRSLHRAEDGLPAGPGDRMFLSRAGPGPNTSPRPGGGGDSYPATTIW